MDNDSKLKKKLVGEYRKLRQKLDYKGMNLLSEGAGNELIRQKLEADKPFMVGRFGAVEMHCVSRWMNGQECTEAEKEQALYAAGIFPNDQETINRFCEVYADAIRGCDVLGVWEVAGEKTAIQKYCPQATLIPSRSIEPYYFENPWAKALEGMKLLVVHPFTETIKQQFEKRALLFPEGGVLPEQLDLRTVKAVQSNAGNEPGFDSWFDALDFMKSEIEKVDFDVAIIGAGAYGLPLTAYCKSLGKKAIQMSGATQILFGIKGKRWDSHPVISTFYNEYWVRPSSAETPPLIDRVEGGSYW